MHSTEGMETSKPLHWCVDWKHLKSVERMMMWFPLIGTQRRIHADLIRQLNARNPRDQAAWESYPRERRTLAAQVSRILIEQLGWPENTIFLPDDPADIVFWDRTGDLAGVEAIMVVERIVGTQMANGFWDNLSTMTFSQVIQKMEEAKTDRRPSTCHSECKTDGV